MGVGVVVGGPEGGVVVWAKEVPTHVAVAKAPNIAMCFNILGEAFNILCPPSKMMIRSKVARSCPHLLNPGVAQKLRTDSPIVS